MADPRRQVLAVLGAALLTASVVGCGGAEKGDRGIPKAKPSATASPSPTTPAFARESGGRIVSEALHAMDFIGQVRFTASVVEKGKTYKLDVRNDSKGICSGTVRQGELVTRFVNTHDASYVKGNAEFWRRSLGADAGPVIAYLRGRWAKAEASDEYARRCSTRLLLATKYQSIAEVIGPDPTVSAIQQFHGHAVVEVAGRVGKERYRFLVEVDAPHRIFRMNRDTPGSPGKIVFDFDDDALVVVPGPEDSISLRD